MRVRTVVFSFVASLLVLLIGLPTAQAQMSDFSEPDRFWNEQIAIGLPGDDDEGDDDEGDDEAGECLPYPAPVPATGQTSCFDVFGHSIDCTGTGQDGETQMGVPSPSPRFTDNGNGTVSDNLTGLIWLKDLRWTSCVGWADALSMANTLASGSWGLSDGSSAGDWRLPSIKELLSLIDYGQAPPLPADHPFSFPPTLGRWASTSVTGLPSYVYYAEFMRGTTRMVNKQNDDCTATFWAVRGPYDEDGQW